MHHNALKKRDRLEKAVIKKALEWGLPRLPYGRNEDWLDVYDQRIMELCDAVDALRKHINTYGKEA
ncbi:MAG TPA: hypothetical protein ENI23_17385 [bacterium]|nr:hypothetical protein [bacterium]